MGRQPVFVGLPRSEASFDDPAFRQQHEASFGHRVLDHFELDTVLLGSFGGVRTGVALVDIGQLDRMACDLQHLFGQRGNLGTVPPHGLA